MCNERRVCKTTSSFPSGSLSVLLTFVFFIGCDVWLAGEKKGGGAGIGRVYFRRSVCSVRPGPVLSPVRG